MPDTPSDETELDAKRALANARTDFRALIDGMPVGVVINRGGRWIYANRAFAQMLGRTADELIGHAPFEFVPLEDRANLTEHMWSLLSGPSAPLTLERRFLRPNGELVFLEVTPTHLADFEGHAALLLLMRDVTEQRRLIAQQLIAERMVSVGTLAAGVAHEINNPLASVMSNLQVALEEMELLREAGSPKLREVEQALRDAYEGAERVRKIVRGMRTLSRGDEDVRVPIDVHKVIESAVGMTQNEVRHRARLVRDFGRAPLVVADEGRLGQVLINLLANAAQAIREGNVEKNEIRVVTGTDPDGSAVIEVHDTGEGIPAHLVARVFDPFFTTKEVGAGLGLGLSICHGIVTSMGGEIDVTTEVGKGTRFRVRLPPAPVDSIARLMIAPPVRTPASGRARVLVVDDDPLVRKGLRRILSEHDITLAESGRDARAVLREDSSFDLIVCDLIMPEMTGMDLYHELSATMPELLDRIVFTTGGAFTAAARAFLDQVPNRRMHKPFDTDRLRTLADECARRRRERADPAHPV